MWCKKTGCIRRKRQVIFLRSSHIFWWITVSRSSALKWGCLPFNIHSVSDLKPNWKWNIFQCSNLHNDNQISMATTSYTRHDSNTMGCQNPHFQFCWQWPGRRRAFTEAVDTDVLHKSKSSHLRLSPVTTVSDDKAIMSGSEKGHHIICWRWWQSEKFLTNRIRSWQASLGYFMLDNVSVVSYIRTKEERLLQPNGVHASDPTLVHHTQKWSGRLTWLIVRGDSTFWHIPCQRVDRSYRWNIFHIWLCLKYLHLDTGGFGLFQAFVTPFLFFWPVSRL